MKGGMIIVKHFMNAIMKHLNIILPVGLFILVVGISLYLDQDRDFEVDKEIQGAIISRTGEDLYISSTLNMKGEIVFRSYPMYRGAFSLIPTENEGNHQNDDNLTNDSTYNTYEPYKFDDLLMHLVRKKSDQPGLFNIVNHHLDWDTYERFHSGDPYREKTLSCHIYYDQLDFNKVMIYLENGDLFVGPCDNLKEAQDLVSELSKGTIHESWLRIDNKYKKENTNKNKV